MFLLKQVKEKIKDQLANPGSTGKWLQQRSSVYVNAELQAKFLKPPTKVTLM